MKEQETNRPNTINMLLDIDKFSGEHEGRIGPVVLFLLLSGIPAIVYIYYLLGVIPVAYYLPIYLLYIIRLAMVILGEERKRVEQYKRQLYDIYSSTYDLLNIKTIHEDGCLEYVNGNICYMVMAVNGNNMDPIVRAQIVRRFLLQLNEEYIADVYIQNIVSADELSKRYNGVKLFNDNEVAKDFIEMIDYTRSLTMRQSLLTRTVFVVKAKRKEFKLLKSSIESALASDDAKIFKGLRIAKKEEVEDIVSRDIDTYINFEEIQRQKYTSGNYYGSKVLGYDLKEKEEVIEVIEERGFMVNE